MFSSRRICSSSFPATGAAVAAGAAGCSRCAAGRVHSVALLTTQRRCSVVSWGGNNNTNSNSNNKCRSASVPECVRKAAPAHLSAAALISGGAMTHSKRMQSSSSSTSSTSAADNTAAASGEFSHLTYNLLWGLWNEGNLFSLSAPELLFFLQDQKRQGTPAAASMAIDPRAKKSVLVRQVEDLLSRMNAVSAATLPGGGAGSASDGAPLAYPGDSPYGDHLGALAARDGGAVSAVEDVGRREEAMNDADEYGDWGAEPHSDAGDLTGDAAGASGEAAAAARRARRATSSPVFEISPQNLGNRYNALVPRAYQLLHSGVTSDCRLHPIDVSRLPGFRGTAAAGGGGGDGSSAASYFAVSAADPYEANRARFLKGFAWAVYNIWHLNLVGEINAGLGKVLFYAQLAKHGRSTLPLWSLQRQAYNVHPYSFCALASAENLKTVEGLVVDGNNSNSSNSNSSSPRGFHFEPVQGPATTYRLCVTRGVEQMDVELNPELRPTRVNRPWDRLFVCHYVREQRREPPASAHDASLSPSSSSSFSSVGRVTMPDVRFVVRARHPMKKAVQSLLMEAEVLRRTRDSVQSVLSPELGDVTYCCERQIRKWRLVIDPAADDNDSDATTSGGSAKGGGSGASSNDAYSKATAADKAAFLERNNIQILLVETRRTPLIISRAGDEGTKLEYEFIVDVPTSSALRSNNNNNSNNSNNNNSAKMSEVRFLGEIIWEYSNRLAQTLEGGLNAVLAGSRI